MIIYLCRHGQRGPDGPEREGSALLTDFGHDQARRLGAYLRRKSLQALFASPKVRTLQTAAPTRDYTGLVVNVWPVLIEHNSFGPLDYSAESVVAYGAVLDDSMLLASTPQHEEKSFAYRRAEFALARLRSLGMDRVAVFAHDCFNSIFIWAWLGRGCLGEANRYPQRECCVNILEDGGEPKINLDVLEI